MTELNERHPSTVHMRKMLKPNVNLPSKLYQIAADCDDLGTSMIDRVDDSPELTAGLRKLLEAKDCFVRAALDLDTVDYRDR